MSVAEDSPIWPDDDNLVAHARRELELLGEKPQMIENYLKVVRVFAELQLPYGYAETAAPILNQLFRRRNLTALTDWPDDWVRYNSNVPSMVFEDGLLVWQSKRNPAAFSADHGRTYWITEGELRSVTVTAQRDERWDQHEPW
jgi:hypothetical protein